MLPKGGPREDERRADQALHEMASGFDHPELALLFGRPDEELEVVTRMSCRTRLVFLVVAAIAAVPGLLAIDGMVLNDARSSSTAVVRVIDPLDALVATPARSQPVFAAVRGLPLSLAVIAAATLITSGRLRSMTGGPPLGLLDVGDVWRALLLGAPPILL